MPGTDIFPFSYTQEKMFNSANYVLGTSRVRVRLNSQVWVKIDCVPPGKDISLTQKYGAFVTGCSAMYYKEPIVLLEIT